MRRKTMSSIWLHMLMFQLICNGQSQETDADNINGNRREINQVKTTIISNNEKSGYEKTITVTKNVQSVIVIDDDPSESSEHVLTQVLKRFATATAQRLADATIYVVDKIRPAIRAGTDNFMFHIARKFHVTKEVLTNLDVEPVVMAGTEQAQSSAMETVREASEFMQNNVIPVVVSGTNKAVKNLEETFQETKEFADANIKPVVASGAEKAAKQIGQSTRKALTFVDANVKPVVIEGSKRIWTRVIEAFVEATDFFSTNVKPVMVSGAKVAMEHIGQQALETKDFISTNVTPVVMAGTKLAAINMADSMYEATNFVLANVTPAMLTGTRLAVVNLGKTAKGATQFMVVNVTPLVFNATKEIIRNLITKPVVLENVQTSGNKAEGLVLIEDQSNFVNPDAQTERIDNVVRLSNPNLANDKKGQVTVVKKVIVGSPPTQLKKDLQRLKFDLKQASMDKKKLVFADHESVKSNVVIKKLMM